MISFLYFCWKFGQTIKENYGKRQVDNCQDLHNPNCNLDDHQEYQLIPILHWMKDIPKSQDHLLAVLELDPCKWRRSVSVSGTKTTTCTVKCTQCMPCQYDMVENIKFIPHLLKIIYFSLHLIGDFQSSYSFFERNSIPYKLFLANVDNNYHIYNACIAWWDSLAQECI